MKLNPVSPLLRVVSRLLLPLILLFALYVQFHGDYGPGGGFQAGVIFASAIVLHTLVFGLERAQQVLPDRVLKIGVVLGVLLYIGTGLASLLRGGLFLDYNVLAADPVAGQHLGILVVEFGVGLTVTCAMTLLFFAFVGRGRGC